MFAMLPITLALMTGILFSQNSKSMQEGVAVPQDLTISLLISSRDVLTGEPIQVAIKVSNTTGKTITFMGSNSVFTFIRSNGVEMQFTPEGVPLPLPEIPHAIVFQPHEEKYFTTALDFDRAQHGASVTEQEGTVELGVQVYGLTAQTLKIVVHRPAGVDAEALDWLRRQDGMVKFLATDAGARYRADQRVIERLEELTRLFPTSKYSEYAMLACAGILMNGGGGRRDPVEARSRLLLVAQSKWPEIAGTAYYYLGLMAREENDFATALSEFQSIDKMEAPFSAARASQQIAFIGNRGRRKN